MYAQDIVNLPDLFLNFFSFFRESMESTFMCLEISPMALSPVVAFSTLSAGTTEPPTMKNAWLEIWVRMFVRLSISQKVNASFYLR